MKHKFLFSMIALALISLATCLRALSTAAAAVQPNLWFRLAGLPKFSVK